MKSLAQQLSEAFDKLEERGKFGMVQEIKLMNRPLEAKLVAAEKALQPRVTKHNGAADNGTQIESFRESARTAREERHQKNIESLVESFKLMGLSQEEAEIAAGAKDVQLGEALRNGDKAADFWKLLTESK
jgi:hypothetical protein